MCIHWQIISYIRSKTIIRPLFFFFRDEHKSENTSHIKLHCFHKLHYKKLCSTIVYRILQSIYSFYLKTLGTKFYMYSMCTSCKSNITKTALIFKHTNHGTQWYKTCIRNSMYKFTNSKLHKLYAIAIWIRTFHQHLIIDMCTVHRLQFYIAFLLKPLFIN